MLKKLMQFVSISLVFLYLQPNYLLAQTGSSSKDDKDAKTAEYLQKFGTYFGIDVTKAQQLPERWPIPTPDLLLLDKLGTFVVQNQLIKCKEANSTLIACALEQFKPNPLFDQQPYANDPTWQGIMNLITTPPVPYSCSKTIDKCLTIEKIQENFFGSSQGAGISFPYPLNAAGNLVPPSQANPRDQALNVNSLLGPLNYDLPFTLPTQKGAESSPGSSASPEKQKVNMKELAENFIRITTGQANPPKIPSMQEFRTALLDNKEGMYNALARLNTFAALASISISNFNEMLARRMPNPNNPKPEFKQFSQAQAEYYMATRRLSGAIDPSNPQGKSWRHTMEDAPPIVLQREMLDLLNEINYQLYLQRKQDERVLATLSAMHIQQLEMMKNALNSIAPPK